MANPKIVQFPSAYKPPSPADQGTWLAGYAAGLADASRGGFGNADFQLKETGITLAHFIEAGTEEYDLEELRKLYGDAE